ncbi:hypothetical protein [Agrobacterium sp. SORGH_AS 787]|uniref:hypothetical protein n=1 Tax=Agrobacterium sp. SORGH_AS 787 TaxID=3041775 RepID=UPI002780BA51|nr:hypothetical protein [Rhizobium sp. SORGH_AS_0787]
MTDIKHPDDIVLDPLRHPSVAGMRYNGYCWVDELSEDRPFVPIIRQEQPGQDMFGGSGKRTPPRAKKVLKTRRRGPLA